MDHVRIGYGRAETTGPDRDTGATSRLVETSEGGSVPVVDKVQAGEDDQEVSTEDLRATQDELIQSGTADIVVVDDGEAHDETPT
jgi:hypothetical protein